MTDVFRLLQKALSGTTTTAHIKMYEPAVASVRVKVPEPDDSYFYTAGRAVSYFPKVNANGISFFREDCKNVSKTLMASLADVQHIKPGYPSPDPKGEKNTSFGAICDLVEHEEGIDILVKNEREIAKAMGYTEDDFKPGQGEYSSFSQECDFNVLECKWIVVDKSDPTKLLKEVGYLEGMAQGFRCSRMSEGKWDYYLHDGNPVYIRLKPTSFTGVGHVIDPADSSAVIYSYAADSGLDAMLASLFPGMEGPNITAPLDSHSLITAMAQDFQDHPDLMTCSVGAGDDFLIPNVTDIEKPYGDSDPDDHLDSCYAAVWSEPMYKNSGPPVDMPAKAFKVKNDKGKWDREKLISAYHALSGLRGNTSLANRIPQPTRAHALLIVRQGLNETKPKENKKVVSQINQPGIEAEMLKIEDRKALIEAMSLESNKAVSALKEKLQADHDQAIKDKESAHTKAIAAKDEELTALRAELETVKTELTGLKSEKLVASRIAALEAILPFGEDEKKSDAYTEYTKSLASYDEDRFETEILKRQNKALASELKQAKSTSSRTVNPIPGFTAPTVTDENADKLSVDTLY